MVTEEPYPDLGQLIADMGQAGHRLRQIEASEGAAGNISIYVGWTLEPGGNFPQVEGIPLPAPAPELASAT